MLECGSGTGGSAKYGKTGFCTGFSRFGAGRKSYLYRAAWLGAEPRAGQPRNRTRSQQHCGERAPPGGLGTPLYKRTERPPHAPTRPRAAPLPTMSARERLQAQDAQLQRLGAGVDRIRNLGETMHDETRQQLGLLDQLEGDVDETTSGIREETKHAEDVAVSGQTFYMYVCIAILVLVMVLELIIGLQ